MWLVQMSVKYILLTSILFNNISDMIGTFDISKQFQIQNNHKYDHDNNIYLFDTYKP